MWPVYARGIRERFAAHLDGSGDAFRAALEQMG
jgi:hypothetical protein